MPPDSQLPQTPQPDPVPEPVIDAAAVKPQPPDPAYVAPATPQASPQPQLPPQPGYQHPEPEPTVQPLPDQPQPTSMLPPPEVSQPPPAQVDPGQSAEPQPSPAWPVPQLPTPPPSYPQQPPQPGVPPNYDNQQMPDQFVQALASQPNQPQLAPAPGPQPLPPPVNNDPQVTQPSPGSSLSDRAIAATPDFAAMTSYSQHRQDRQRHFLWLILAAVGLLVLVGAGYWAYLSFIKPQPSPTQTFQASVKKQLQTKSLAYSTDLVLRDSRDSLVSTIKNDFKVEHLGQPNQVIIQQEISVDMTTEGKSSVSLAASIIWHQDKAYLKLNRLELGEVPPVILLTNNISDDIIELVKDKWLVFNLVDGEVLKHLPTEFEDYDLEQLQDDQLLDEFLQKKSIDGLITFSYETLLSPDQGLATLIEVLPYIFIPFGAVDDASQRQQLSQALFGTDEMVEDAATTLDNCQDLADNILECQFVLAEPDDTVAADNDDQSILNLYRSFIQESGLTSVLNLLTFDTLPRYQQILPPVDSQNKAFEITVAVNRQRNLANKITARFNTDAGLTLWSLETNYKQFNQDLGLEIPRDAISPDNLLEDD